MTDTHSLHFVRDNIACLPPVPHGSIGAEELAPFGLTPAGVVDFSVNTNPLGPAATMLRAIGDTDWARYPGDDEAPLRSGLAIKTGLTPEHVALGNGSAELLWLIALAVLQPGDRVLVMSPTFGEYARAARCVDAEVNEIHALQGRTAARLLFTCNPNNPTGSYFGQADIEHALYEQPGRLMVLDEAYAAFASDPWRSEVLLANYPNLIILRSLTKEHALPGLRLGYVLAAPELACAIESVRPPWSVNAGALRAGLASLGSAADNHLERARSVVATARDILTRGFTRLGYPVSPSAANFVLINVGDARSFRSILLPHGFVVRDCASFGLPSHVRVACRLPEECQALLDMVLRLRDARQLPSAGAV